MPSSYSGTETSRHTSTKLPTVEKPAFATSNVTSKSRVARRSESRHAAAERSQLTAVKLTPNSALTSLQARS